MLLLDAMGVVGIKGVDLCASRRPALCCSPAYNSFTNRLWRNRDGDKCVVAVGKKGKCTTSGGSGRYEAARKAGG